MCCVWWTERVEWLSYLEVDDVAFGRDSHVPHVSLGEQQQSLPCDVVLLKHVGVQQHVTPSATWENGDETHSLCLAHVHTHTHTHTHTQIHEWKGKCTYKNVPLSVILKSWTPDRAQSWAASCHRKHMQHLCVFPQEHGVTETSCCWEQGTIKIHCKNLCKTKPWMGPPTPSLWAEEWARCPLLSAMCQAVPRPQLKAAAEAINTPFKRKQDNSPPIPRPPSHSSLYS